MPVGEMVASPVSMLSDQSIITPTSREYILYLLVVQARERDATFAELLPKTPERAHVDLAVNLKAFRIINDVSQMSNSRGCLFKYISSLKYGLEPLESLVGRFYGNQRCSSCNFGS